jgi:23S rRNA (adenine2030-N6)-methyltransferase
MLSYQHVYHAGGMADVAKHAVLLQLIHALKPLGPLTYLETHAGRGLYPLAAPEMNKVGEYRHGFLPLWNARATLPDTLLPLVEALGDLNPHGEPTFYPGSPWLAAHALGQGGALHLAEAHPGEFAHLEQTFADDSRIRLHHADGHKHIPGLRLPPRPTLALIDPSYELKIEYRQTAQTAGAILKRLPQSMVMVWYPLLPAMRHTELVEALKPLTPDSRTRWVSEWEWAKPDETRGAYGTGLAVINLPERWKATLDQTLTDVQAILGKKPPQA